MGRRGSLLKQNGGGFARMLGLAVDAVRLGGMRVEGTGRGGDTMVQHSEG